MAAAAAVLHRCQQPWRAQRGPAGRLSGAEREALLPVVALALRRTTPGAVVELLTDRVRSARHLPSVLAARCWRLIRDRPEHGRRIVELAVDEDGTRWQAMVAARPRRGAEASEAMASARVALAKTAAAARAALREPSRAGGGRCRFNASQDSRKNRSEPADK